MIRTHAPAAAFVCAAMLLCVPASTSPKTSSAALFAAQTVRADATIARYNAAAKRLDQFYRVLFSALGAERQAPLAAELQPPEPAKYGYEILPTLVEKKSRGYEAARPSGYSWPWTDKLIDDALRQLADLESQIRDLSKINSAARQRLSVSITERYLELRARMQNIDAHVQYNRLWQTAIAHDRPGYDQETAKFYLVLQREAVRRLLNFVGPLDGPSQSTWRAELPGTALFESRLRERYAALTKEIDGINNPSGIPNFLRVEHRNNDWIFKVRFYTDIEDLTFIKSFKENVEEIWHARQAGVGFSVELEFFFISPRDLYGAATFPEDGSVFDMDRHLALFPQDSAILTTGAATTHVRGRAIVLGPHNIDGRILAHEFGHILGFRDAYVRGYKNLGRNGFEVLEAVIDPGDIMGRADSGAVFPAHFEQLLRQIAKKTARENSPGEGRSLRRPITIAGSVSPS